MRRTGFALLVAMPLVFGAGPARAQMPDLALLMLLAGPVSEAVQEAVLLIRRGGNFVSTDSLVVACAASASAGVMVGVAPALGLTASGVPAPVAISYVLGSAVLACGMGLASGAAAMGTGWALDAWRNPAPIEPVAGKPRK